MSQFIEALKESKDKAIDSVGSNADAIVAETIELIHQLNNAEIQFDSSLCTHLVGLLEEYDDERLFTVTLGTLWREDISWLEEKGSSGRTFRLLLMHYAAKTRPDALSAQFWVAIADRGGEFVDVAFAASKDSYPHQAAALLVKRAKAAIGDPFKMDIGAEVSSFLDGRDVSVRNSFLDAVKDLQPAEKRKLMTHLDMSLMAELDQDAIEHKAKDFFYDEEAERRKRESKGGDIFAEVARRLENGEKPS